MLNNVIVLKEIIIAGNKGKFIYFFFKIYTKSRKNWENLQKGGIPPTKCIKKGESPPQNPERGHSPRKRGMWQHCSISDFVTGVDGDGGAVLQQ